MTNQTLSDEQQAFVEAIRDFAQRECGTREQRDALTGGGEEAHNTEIYKKIADLGWLGIAIPEEHGGSGGGAVDMCLLIENFMHGMIPMLFYSVSMVCAGAVERFGSDELKHEILGGIAAGSVNSIAMSEPEAGSDVANLSCRAERIDGHFVVNGQKTWITGAHEADHLLLVCRTDRAGSKHEGLTMLSVPTSLEGIEIRGIQTMGAREVNDVFFTDCQVPAERLVGRQDEAWKQLMAGLNHERLIIAAQALGLAQRAFDDVLAYVKARKQFGRPIGSFQALRHRLADLATELEATRLLVYDTAAKVDANPGKLFPREASMCKLKATEIAKQVTIDGMQMMGGYGYASEYDMQLHMREAVVMTVFGGASEIQRDIISKTLGL